MQRVSSLLPSWEKRKSGPKNNGGRSWWPNRSSSSGGSLARINIAAANNARVQKEAFWPATLDQECDKAARILKSLCTDGYLAPVDDEPPTSPSSSSNEPATPVKVTKKIPKRIIQNAAGIAIFTCMRSGLWMTGSGGSGILIARKSDGTWSPPSGIMLHTPTLSFIMGVDVYDCVLVVNSLSALEAITRPRLTLGEDIQLLAGPLVTLDSTEADVVWADLGNTVLTYLKARGQNQNVNLNGCILTERGNENERFYGGTVTQMDVLAGNVNRHVEETKPLFEVIKMAEGRTDFETAVIDKIATEPAPGDAVIATPKSTPASPRNAFGLPSANDPDPFGVLALEMAGLEIREAGTRLRPGSNQFEFHPAPASPAHSKFNRQSVETFVSKSNRGSYMSTRTTKSIVSDAGTQTEVNKTPDTSPSSDPSEDGVERHSVDQMPKVKEEDPEEVDYTRVDTTPLKHLSQSPSIEEHPAVEVEAEAPSQRRTSSLANAVIVVDDYESSTQDAKVSSQDGHDYDGDHDGEEDEDDDDDDAEFDGSDDGDDDEDDEEPIVFEVAAVQPARTQVVTSRVIQAKGSMVTIPKRIPPPLPTRSPARISRSSKSDMGGDVSSIKSPLRQTFSGDEESAHGDKVEEQADGSLTKEAGVERNSLSAMTSQQVTLEVPNAAETTAEEVTPTADRHSLGTELPLTVSEHAPTENSLQEVSGHELTEPRVGDEVQDSTENAENARHEEDNSKETQLTNGDAPVSDAANPTSIAHDDLSSPADTTELIDNDVGLSHGDQDTETEHSDSISKKHASSIYTGATEDQWSHDGSSVTTPTSERPHSATDESRLEDTPTKSKKAFFDGASEDMSAPASEDDVVTPTTTVVS